MTSQIQKIAILVAALVVIGGGIVGASVLHIGPFGSNERGPVIATVDGQPIYLADARSRLEGLTSVHGGSDLEKTLGPNWQEMILQSLVDDHILQQEADRRGISVTDQDVAIALQRVQQMFNSAAEFQKWLDGQGMTQAELESRIRLQTLAADVYNAVTADVTVTNGEVRAYYEKTKDKYVGSDGQPLPLSTVRASLRKDLEKKGKDQAYATWLQEARTQVNVQVLLEDWWKDLA